MASGAGGIESIVVSLLEEFNKAVGECIAECTKAFESKVRAAPEKILEAHEELEKCVKSCADEAIKVIDEMRDFIKSLMELKKR